jgi:predicted enzyme related to lactoylglutathione lyase
MKDKKVAKSGIVWFYYDNLTEASTFYEQTMGFELVVDQQWAKVYRIDERAFVGVVAGEKGSFRPQDHNAVLLTIVVDEVRPWLERLRSKGASITTDVLEKEEIGVRCFFLKDPGGYAIEVQQFLDPEVSRQFVG